VLFTETLYWVSFLFVCRGCQQHAVSTQWDTSTFVAQCEVFLAKCISGAGHITSSYLIPLDILLCVCWGCFYLPVLAITLSSGYSNTFSDIS